MNKEIKMSKRLIVVSITAVMMLFATAISAQVEIMLDPSFELQTAATLDGEMWYEDGDGLDITVELDAGTARTGANCVAITGNGGWTGIGQGPIDLLPETEYICSAWVKGDDFGNNSGTFGFWDEAAGDGFELWDWNADTTDWKELTLTFTTFASTLDTVEYWFWLGTEEAAVGAVFKVDDISLEKVTAGYDGHLRLHSYDANPGAVDLTAEGTLDWIKYEATSGVRDSTRKASATAPIMSEALVDSAEPGGATGQGIVYTESTLFGNTFSWTDGTPVATGTNVEGSLYMAGEGNGFRFKVPASTTTRTFTLYAGMWDSEMKLSASLSDGSAPAQSKIFLRREAGGPPADGNISSYFVEFAAAADEETLTVEWTIETDMDLAYGGWGNGPVRAVTLREGALAVDAGGNLTPRGFALAQNYPNPFNPVTNLDFTLPSAGAAKLVVFDLVGHKVRTLVDSPMQAGTHSVVWDGRDDAGNQLSSGIYFYRLTAGQQSWTKKMMFLK
jgi:hypothetical protein